MKKISFLTISFLIAFFSPAFADTTEEATEVYTDMSAPSDQLKPTGFQGVLGALLFSGQRIIGDDGWRTLPLPLILIRYKELAYWSIGGRRGVAYSGRRPFAQVRGGHQGRQGMEGE